MSRKFKNVLVTGGSGFIGSNFILNFLKKNISGNILNLDKLTYAGNNANLESLCNEEMYKFFKGDICDESLVKKILSKFEVDAIVNFAAESHVDRSITGPSEFINTNVLGTFNLLKCAQEHHKKLKNFCFLHVSTDEVYGSLELDDPSFREDNKYAPNSPYSASKASSDHLVRAWFHTYDLPVLTTNCSNNYGPYQFPEKLIPLTIDNALNNKEITVYGDGKNIRDWLFVIDHCDAIESVLQNGKFGEVYNVGGLNEKTNIYIVETICKILDNINPQNKSHKNLIKFVEDRPGHDFRYSVNAAKIKNDLGWEPKETFETGILKTVNWYFDNTDWINSVKEK